MLASDDEIFEGCDLAVTATTGIAAFQLGGTTLHSFAGIGMGNGTFESHLRRVSENERAAERWEGISHLIIDESKRFYRLFLTY